MRTVDEALEQLGARIPSRSDAHAAVRDTFAYTTRRLWDLLPDGPDKTVVLRELQSAKLQADNVLDRQQNSETHR